MEKFFIICMVILGNLCLAQPKYNAAYLHNKDDAFNALFTEMTDNGWLYFKEDKAAKISPEAFVRQYARNLGLSEGYHLKAVKEETDEQQETKIKTRHQLFQLYYKNVLVEGGEFSMHSVDDVLKVAHGRIVAGLKVDISKPINEKAALETALTEQNLTSDSFDKKELPEGVLLLTRTDENFVKESYTLAYSFELKGERINESYKVFVNAQTGKVIKKIPLFKNCFGFPSGKSLTPKNSHQTKNGLTNVPLVASTLIPNYPRYLNGQSSIGFETEQVGSPFRLSAFGNKLNTRIDVYNTGQWSSNPDVFNPSSNWNNANRTATTAHWIVQRMYSFQQYVFLRNGYDGNGNFPRVLVDWDEDNAQWNPSQNTIRFGRLQSGASLVTIDVVGHEYTHAVDEKTCNLTYAGESGALDESIADIMGTTLEFDILGPNANYQLGEDAQAFRDMANPPGFGQPDRYMGPGWVPTGCGTPTRQNDFCGVHTNSGVMNKWYWYMRTGGPNGIPLDHHKPAKIVYQAQRYYLHPNSTYADAADATIQAAEDVYGACSHIPRQVAYAWTLVGGNVIQRFSSCTDCNFEIAPSATPASNISCSSPISLSANCSGTGCTHMKSYQWVGEGISQTSAILQLHLILQLHPARILTPYGLLNWDVI